MYKLLWFEPAWVLLIGAIILLPGKLTPLTWHPYLLITLFLFWPLRWLGKYRAGAQEYNVSRITTPFLNHSLTIPTNLILGWLFINLWASVDHTTSWIAAGYLLLGVALFTSLIYWSTAQRNPLYVARFLLILGGSLAIVSPPFIEWKPQFRLFHLPIYDRLQSLHINLGETIHANVLAGVLVLVLPIFVALTLCTNYTYRRWVWYLCNGVTLIIFVILVLTQSRAGYLAITIALLVVVSLHWPRLLYIAPFVLFGAIVSVQWVGVQTLLEQVSSDTSLGGWEGRLDIWQNSLHALADFAFTGIGIGTFTLVMPLLYPLQVSIEGYPHAHNLFLQIGLDLGLPGLIAYLAILINLFVMLISTLRSRHTLPLHRTLAIGATGSLVGMLVHGLLDAVTWGTKLAFVPWVLFALITQLFLYTKATQANPGSSS